MTTCKKEASTFEAVIADASMNVMLCACAYASPCAVSIARASARSVLLPTSIIVMSAVAFSFSSVSHFSTFSNDVSFVMSYTMSAPTAPR